MMNGDQLGSAGVYGSFPRNDLIWPIRRHIIGRRRGTVGRQVVGSSDDSRGKFVRTLAGIIIQGLSACVSAACPYATLAVLQKQLTYSPLLMPICSHLESLYSSGDLKQNYSLYSSWKETTPP
jgi:hypothetical protein